MAKKKTEEVVEKATEDNVTKVDLKKKAQQLKSNVTKIDLNKPLEKGEEVEKQPVDEDVVVVNPDTTEETKEEVKEETPVIQDVTNEIPKVEVPKVEVPSEPKVVLPEKLQKVAKFMEETGGDLNDYVKLNRDLSKLDDSEVLDEYYRNTKAHLSPEERNFILEERFSYNKDEDDPKDVKRKQIALKEQVAEARSHLDGQKSKYYEEIKMGSKLPDEAQKAMDFFNRYNEESEATQKTVKTNSDIFTQKTNNVFCILSTTIVHHLIHCDYQQN